MRLSSRLILALALVLPVIRAHAELPTTDDPLPFAEIDYATTQRDAPADESSISDQATRPSEPISTIDHRGDPDLIEFRGLAQVSADDIRKALRWDPKFQAAARPSNNTAVFLNVLESRVLDGFQSSGFPDAKVAVSLDTATRRFVVAVTEGPRFRQGKIVVTGDDRVDAKQIADWLTHEQKPHLWKIRYADAAAPAPPEKGVTLWESGENLNFTPRVRGIFEAGVRMALIEQGFPYASFDLEYVPASEPGLSDLHVNLRHVGAPSTIKEIKVEGLNRDTREQLLEYLQIAPGQRFDPASLDRVHSKLEDSCRYWCHKIEVHCGQKPDGRYAPTDESVNLELELVEFSPAPPLHQALSEVDEVLRKATDWLNRYPRGVEQDLVFEVTARGKKVDEGNLTILPSAASADGRLALNCRFQKPGKWSFDHTLLSSPSETALVDWRAKEKFVSSVLNRVKLNLDIAASLKEDGTYGGRLKAGWTVSGDKTESENSGGDLDSSRGTCRVDPYCPHRRSFREDRAWRAEDQIAPFCTGIQCRVRCADTTSCAR